MDREMFYNYFEQVFFSNESQDILKSKDKMIQSIGDVSFIQNLLNKPGENELYVFLNKELEYDEWETLIEFFVENGIVMLDICGYDKYLGSRSLEKLELLYKGLLQDMYKVSQLEVCTLEDLQFVLETQIIRLRNLLISSSIDNMKGQIS